MGSVSQEKNLLNPFKTTMINWTNFRAQKKKKYSIFFLCFKTPGVDGNLYLSRVLYYMHGMYDRLFSTIKLEALKELPQGKND